MTVKYSGEGIRDNTDETKVMSFDVSGVTTNTTRTLTMPDRNVTIGDAGDLTGNLPALDGSSLSGFKTVGGTAIQGSGDIAVGGNSPYFYASKLIQSVSEDVTTKLTADTYEVDSNSAFSNGTFTVPSGEAGKYLFISAVRGTCVGVGIREITHVIRKNGTTVTHNMGGIPGNPDSAQTGVTSTNSVILDLSVGDYVEVFGAVNAPSASSRNIHNWFTGFKIG